MRIILLGDIFGRPGRKIVKEALPQLREVYQPDVIVANGENAAGGFGLTKKVAEELFEMGIDVITSGNHIWDKKEVYPYLQEERRVLRPANYPPGVPGSFLHYLPVGTETLAVLSLTGRVFMGDFDCPFRKFDQLYAEMSQRTHHIVVDFHGEATSEKIAFGWYADGRASVVVGTHTHVATADQRILGRGTGYVTDLGMCGPVDGVLGVDRQVVIQKFLTQLPNRFTVAPGPSQLNGVFVELDRKGKTTEILRLPAQENIV